MIYNSFKQSYTMYKLLCVQIFLVFTVLLISCKRDLGTTKANSVEGADLLITNIEDNYVAIMGDTIKIMPTIKNQDGTPIDTSKYSIYWIQTSANGLLSNGEDGFDTIIGNVFNYPLSFNNPHANGKNNWTLKVLNKQNEIFTQKAFVIASYSPTTEGYYVMSQTGINQSRLGMIYYNTGSGEYDTVSDILSTMYIQEGIAPSYSLKGNPISVNYGSSSMGGYFLDFISVITDQDGSFLNPSNLTTTGANGNTSSQANFSTILGSVVSGYTPAKIKSYACNIYYGFGIINYDGTLYQDDGMINAVSFDNTPLSAPGSSGPINSSKWIGVNDDLINQPGGVATYVLFDVDKQVFYNYFMGDVSNLPIKGYSARNKLLYNHYTDYGGGRYYAVLQSNNSDSTFLLSFNNSGTMYAYNFLNVEGIDSTTHFAISATDGYLFYNIGNNIYEYDIVKNKSFFMVNYPNRSISYMEGPQIPWDINTETRTLNLSQSIIIATYDPSNLENSGTVDVYKVPASNGLIQKQNSYSGFGKVVSMTYKQTYS